MKGEGKGEERKEVKGRRGKKVERGRGEGKAGVDLPVTSNHIHLCGASIITCLFNYQNILLQERLIIYFDS